MKIRVSYLVEVDIEDRALVRLAREATPSGIRTYIQSEAEGRFIDFLEENGVTVAGYDG